MTYERYGFNSLRYGNASRFYGVPGSPSTTRLWSIEIDRDNDGAFDGSNEAIYCIGMDIDRGFLQEFDTNEFGADGMSMPMVGTCTLKFDNSTGRYNLWNTDGSPSTDNLPGRKARIRVREGYSSTDTEVFYGYVRDISNNPTDNTATIRIHDGVEILQERVANIALFSDTDFNTAGQTAFIEVLDNIGWTDGYNIIDSGSATGFAYFSCNDTAYRVIHDLMQEDTNLVYVDAAGQVVWDYSENNYSATDSNTFDESILLKPIIVSQPWENLFTKLNVNVYKFSYSATDTVIWSKETEDDIAVGANSSINFLIDYRYDDATIDRFVAFANTLQSSDGDYVVNTSSDGSGSNITASCSVSFSELGSGARLTLTNGSTDSGYFTTLQVKGTVVYWRKTMIEHTLDNWGETPARTLTIDTPYNMNYNADSVKYNEFFYLGYPHLSRRVTVKLRNQPEQFWQDINSPTYFTIAKPKFTASQTDNMYRIMRIRHKWMSANGQDIETEWTCRHALVNVSPVST
jgi:hypothetical protein